MARYFREPAPRRLSDAAMQRMKQRMLPRGMPVGDAPQRNFNRMGVAAQGARAPERMPNIRHVDVPGQPRRAGIPGVRPASVPSRTYRQPMLTDLPKKVDVIDRRTGKIVGTRVRRW